MIGRRGLAVAALAGLVGVGGCAVGSSPSTPVTSAPPRSVSSPVASAATSTNPATPQLSACQRQAENLSVAAQAGEVLMVGVTDGLDSAEKKAISAAKAGSVILMGSPGSVKATAQLSAALQKVAGDTGILIAVDQEGGLVQRLKGKGFTTIPSASEQAGLSDAELAKAARGWGKELASAGVDLNLAPVADVVPPSFATTNQPVARLHRGYGSDPQLVSDKVAAFSDGMQAAGVATAVKHFPGLGAVTGNTDTVESVVDSTTTKHSARLKPFRDAVNDDVEAVMVSSATYTKIDAKQIATFSPTVIGLLREWGFTKVVISDDLGVAAALKAVPVKQRAVKFIEAGGDLAITTAPVKAAAMAKGLAAAAADDDEFAERLTDAAAKVLTLKEDLGILRCGQ